MTATRLSSAEALALLASTEMRELPARERLAFDCESEHPLFGAAVGGAVVVLDGAALEIYGALGETLYIGEMKEGT